MTRHFIGYRHAAYDTPWWAFPSSRSGRFHQAEADTVQYLCLHPLGPAAETLRHNLGPAGDPDQVRLNLWVAKVSLEDVVTVTFDNCADQGLSPEELVGEDYGPTQQLAVRLRSSGVEAFTVPSAALPGTENLVVFDARVLFPYLAEPVGPADVPTGHLSDGARSPAEVVAHVRWIGSLHAGLDHWRDTGQHLVLADPLATRW